MCTSLGISKIARRSSVNSVKPPPPPVRRSSSVTPGNLRDSNVSFNKQENLNLFNLETFDIHPINVTALPVGKLFR